MQTLNRQTKEKESVGNTRKYSAAFFSTAFFAALVFFAGINMALSTSKTETRQLPEVLQQAADEKASNVKSSHSWAWWLSKYYQELPAAPDVVVFGSSLLGSAHISADANFESKLLDVLAHRQMSFLGNQLTQRLGHEVSIFSLGSPGQMISDSYVISKALFTSSKQPKVVIATIAPRDFIDNTLPCPASTDHYKFFSKFMDLTNNDSIAYPDFFSRLGAEIEKLPIKAASKLSMNKYAEPSKVEYESTSISRVEPGSSMVPAKAIPARVDNTAEYKERFKDPSSASYESEMQFFQSWLSSMQKKGITVMVVGMPTSPENRSLLPEKFWTKYRADVAKTCKQNNAEWFDLSDSGLFQATDYLDTVHLNAYGGVKLFPVIAEKLSSEKKIQDLLQKKR